MAQYKIYKGIIQRAELMAMAPDSVVTYFTKRARQSDDDWRSDDVDEETEAALLGRGDPAIDLAVAKHGRFIAVLKPLFTSSEQSSAVRLAILSNTVVGGVSFPSFPYALFDTNELLIDWLTAAPSEELSALFENHTLGDGFLRELLEGKKPWDQIPEAQLPTIVSRLHTNERMYRPYDNVYLDGYSEYSYGSVFNAAWTLAERVEPNALWAEALNYLYGRLVTNAFSITSPLELTARWHIDPLDADEIAQEAKEVERGWLSNYQGVRKGLARLALSKDWKLLQTLLASDDPALRSAAYADGQINPEQLSAAYERDGELLFNQAVHNHKLWRTQAGREALNAVAWAVVNADKHSDLLAVNILNSIRTDLSKKHPDWFKDEEGFEPELEASDEPATKADLLALSEMFAPSNTFQALEQLKQSLASLNSRLGWVWWISLGALAISLWHR